MDEEQEDVDMMPWWQRERQRRQWRQGRGKCTTINHIPKQYNNLYYPLLPHGSNSFSHDLIELCVKNVVRHATTNKFIDEFFPSCRISTWVLYHGRPACLGGECVWKWYLQSRVHRSRMWSSSYQWTRRHTYLPIHVWHHDHLSCQRRTSCSKRWLPLLFSWLSASPSHPHHMTGGGVGSTNQCGVPLWKTGTVQEGLWDAM